MAKEDFNDKNMLQSKSGELKPGDPLGFQVLMLDADRNPIKCQKYRLYCAGSSIQGETGADGLTKKIKTKSPADEVQIAVERLDASLKIVARALSGYGDKLVTIVSPKVRVSSATLAHPVVKNGDPLNKTEKTAPIYEPRMVQKSTVGKQELGFKVELTETKDGRPIAKIEGDIPSFDFLSDYTEDALTEEDYVWAAKELDVEKAAVKAFVIVESGGAGFFKLGQRMVPKILYERHKFASFTNNKFSEKYPDISLPVPYYNAKALYVAATDDDKKKKGISTDLQYYRRVRKDDSKEVKEQAASLKDLLASGKVTAEVDKYLDGAGSYRGVLKAYQLDPDAALKSCSWGAFQILGEFWEGMKFPSVHEFTKFISHSPKNQVKAFVLYVKYISPGIVVGLRKRDWSSVARSYNGPGYKEFEY